MYNFKWKTLQWKKAECTRWLGKVKAPLSIFVPQCASQSDWQLVNLTNQWEKIWWWQLFLFLFNLLCMSLSLLSFHHLSPSSCHTILHNHRWPPTATKSPFQSNLKKKKRKKRNNTTPCQSNIKKGKEKTITLLHFHFIPCADFKWQ